ncbi:terminase small subunit [Mycobacterium phage AFIS]|nr:terminase small subunit [Mycobacterium phage AFIS]
MGDRGPLPKRSDERVRRNTTEYGEVTTLPVSGPVKSPPLGLTDPHPIVRDLYNSLAESAQAALYQPSDWSYAKFTLHFADQLLKSSKPSSQMLVAVNQMLSSLLVSEGDRRRVRIEVERTKSDGPDASVTTMGELFERALRKPKSS